MALLAISLLTGGLAVSASPAKAAAPYWAVNLDVPVVTQSSNDGCGAASAAMVLQKYGFSSESEASVRAAANQPTGFLSISQIASVINSKAYAHFAGQSYVSNGANGLWLVYLHNEIAVGHPVIVLVGDESKLGNGSSLKEPHFIVVKGFLADGTVIYNDPNPSSTHTADAQISPAGLQAAWTAVYTGLDDYPYQSVASAAVGGDIDGSCKVDIQDYNDLLTDFGQTGIIYGDLDYNNRVDIQDYNILITNFGRSRSGCLHP